MVRVQYEDKLFEVLKRHWPQADEARIVQLSGRLAMDAVLGKASEYNLGRFRGKNKALLELRQVNEIAIKLAEKLDDLGTESSQMLSKGFQLDVEDDLDTWTVIKALAALSTASASAHRVISERPYTPAPSRKPKKTASRTLAKEAAVIFEELTGQAATIPSRDGRAYGPYLDLLAEIFEVVGITASVEAAGRSALKEKRGKKRE